MAPWYRGGRTITPSSLAACLVLGIATRAEAGPTAHFDIVPGAEGAVGHLSQTVTLEQPLEAGAEVTVIAGVVLTCRATGRSGSMSLRVEPGVDWARLPGTAGCAIGGARWEATLTLATPTPGPHGDPVLRLAHAGGRDVEITALDGRVHTVSLLVEVGEPPVTWVQPAEQVGIGPLRVPLTLPEEVPAEPGVDHALVVTADARDKDGNHLGATVLDGLIVRWTGAGVEVRASPARGRAPR